MKTKTFTTIIILALTAIYLNVSATVWRVNPTPNSSAHYSTLQAAHDAATTLNNDTLYLEGSTFSAGGLTITKKLTIIGNGYFLAQNPETQYNIQPSIFNSYVYCNAGSEGSKFIGCTFFYSIYLYTNNLTFERNHFPYGNSSAIYAQVNCSDILILNNYFETYYGYQSINLSQVHSNILIANNYFNGYVTVGGSFSGIFANNIFNYPITIYNSTLVNNIALHTATLSNCVVTYNIGNSTQFGDQNGNQQNVSQTDLFVGPTGTSTDGQWVLKVGSPAIGTGEGGTDIGIFGGEYPYILSGLPPIPAIYSLDAQSLPSNTLDVNLKAKSHN
jgi:hypothetical protein